MAPLEPGSSGVVATIAAVTGAALLKVLEHLWKRINVSTTATGHVRISEIEDAAKLRAEMFEQVQRLWERVQEQDDRIAELHSELMQCQERHATLDGQYRTLLREVNRQGDVQDQHNGGTK